MVKEFAIKQIPVFGNCFSVVENINNKKQIENIIQGIEYINRNFDLLYTKQNNKIDKDFANESNLEFVLLIKRVMEQISNQYKSEKIKYLANFITNVVKKDYSNSFHKEGIIERISNYSIEHISVLKDIYNKTFIYGEIDEKSRGELKNSKININSYEIEGINSQSIKICIRDLKSDGFIDEITGAYFDYTGGSYYITDYGKPCVELLKDLSDN